MFGKGREVGAQCIEPLLDSLGPSSYLTGIGFVDHFFSGKFQREEAVEPGLPFFCHSLQFIVLFGLQGAFEFVDFCDDRLQFVDFARVFAAENCGDKIEHKKMG